jgi:nitroreductase
MTTRPSSNWIASDANGAYSSAAGFLGSIRSCRSYKPDPLTEQTVATAVQIAQRAPSASNHQPYSVALITDPQLRRDLEDTMAVQEFARTAPALLFVYVDWRRQDRIARLLGAPTSMNQLSRLIIGVQDASIFAQALTLALASLGVGTCMLANPLLALSDTAKILGLPHSACLPLVAICAGYPNEAPSQRPRYGIESVLHLNRTSAQHDDEALLEYLERGDAALRAESYFDWTGDGVDNWFDHYRIKYGHKALERTWQPLAMKILDFLDP